MTLVQPEVRRRGRPGSGQTESIQSLVKALAILDCLAHADNPVGVTEVANQVGLPKATAHRLLATLHANSAVSYSSETQRYSLGPSIIRYGLIGVQRLSLHRVAHPYLEELQKRTGETAVLAVRNGRVKVFLDLVESREDIRHLPALGKPLSLHHGGSGQAILAHLPEAELELYLSEAPLPAIPPEMITDPDLLRELLVPVRKKGYAISRGDRTTSIGAPVFDHTGKVIGAIGIFAPTFRVPSGRTRGHAEVTVEVARKISTELGYEAASVSPETSHGIRRRSFEPH
jgi:IclR family transcriptional regulator, acetate operon repressor